MQVFVEREKILKLEYTSQKNYLRNHAFTKKRNVNEEKFGFPFL